MNSEVEPYVGVGPIRFGMTPVEVRQKVGGDFRPFRKTSDSEVETDSFPGLGIHVHYSAQGVCEAVEFGGAVVPTLHGKPLLRAPFRELAEWIRSMDLTAEIDESGLTSKILGIGIYMSSMEDLDEDSEGVMVFVEGYYD